LSRVVADLDKRLKKKPKNERPFRVGGLVGKLGNNNWRG